MIYAVCMISPLSLTFVSQFQSFYLRHCVAVALCLYCCPYVFRLPPLPILFCFFFSHRSIMILIYSLRVFHSFYKRRIQRFVQRLQSPRKGKIPHDLYHIYTRKHVKLRERSNSSSCIFLQPAFIFLIKFDSLLISNTVIDVPSARPRNNLFLITGQRKAHVLIRKVHIRSVGKTLWTCKIVVSSFPGIEQYAPQWNDQFLNLNLMKMNELRSTDVKNVASR